MAESAHFMQSHPALRGFGVKRFVTEASAVEGRGMRFHAERRIKNLFDKDAIEHAVFEVNAGRIVRPRGHQKSHSLQERI